MPIKSQKKHKQTISHKSSRHTRGFKSTHVRRMRVLRERIDKLTSQPPPVSPLDMSAWDELSLPAELLLALRELRFSAPTPIQRACVSPASRLHHVIGAAETGSGKTLAFGLPILTGLLHTPDKTDTREEQRPDEEMGCVGWVDDIPDAEFEQMLSQSTQPVLSNNTSQLCKPLRALILTPTRELCMQVCQHLRAAATQTCVQVVSLVGGLSISKQTRMLSRRPEIVVSTPGRFLQLLEEGDTFCQQLSHLSYLVIDEVDRMLTEGHFTSISLIFDRIPSLSDTGVADGPQVLLFSATVPVQFLDLRRHGREESEGVRKLKRYMSQRQSDVINLTRKSVLVEKLQESRLLVESSNKLFYLYYLLRQAGKFLVFSNSIASLRQLYGLLSTLGMCVLLAHSGMQQKQRLQNLEKFNSSTHGILLASDMASRGIDFRDVSDVIHYHVPATAQLYVHRCGRTARTSEKGGSSLLLVAPEESRRYSTICRDLNKTAGVPNADIALNEVYRYKEAVQLAIKLNRHENSQRRETKDESWHKKASKKLHGEDDLSSSEEDTHSQSLPTRQDRQLLREGKERLRTLLSHIDREQSYVRSYRDGLQSVSAFLTAGDRPRTAAAPYIPLIREKRRRY